MPAFGGHVAGVAVEGRRMLLGRLHDDMKYMMIKRTSLVKVAWI